MMTWIAETLIHVLFTQSSSVSRVTFTFKSIDFVNAMALVETRVALTFIYIDLTVFSVSSSQTMTLEIEILINIGYQY